MFMWVLNQTNHKPEHHNITKSPIHRTTGPHNHNITGPKENRITESEKQSSQSYANTPHNCIINERCCSIFICLDSCDFSVSINSDIIGQPHEKSMITQSTTPVDLDLGSESPCWKTSGKTDLLPRLEFVDLGHDVPGVCQTWLIQAILV